MEKKTSSITTKFGKILLNTSKTVKFRPKKESKKLKKCAMNHVDPLKA